MRALFAYGTLLFPPVLHAVVGRVPRSIAATLEGFARRRVAGELFPAIVEAPGERVAGVVYLALDDRAWRRLDAFEGDLYERRSVVVTPASRFLPSDLEAPGAGEGVAVAIAGRGDERDERRAVSALTYVLRRDLRHRLSAELWDPEVFARDHLAAFSARLGRGIRD